MPAMVLNLVQGVSLNLEYYGAQGPAYEHGPKKIGVPDRSPVSES